MKINNFSRFYAIVKQHGIDKDMKEDLVSQFTNHRTTSLREMSASEYQLMCDTLQYGVNNNHEQHEEVYNASIKRLRSSVLHRMQLLGVNTASWDIVDEFCSSPKIAGKRFSHLTISELRELIPKLEAIKIAGGISQRYTPPTHIATSYLYNQNNVKPS